MHHEHHSPQPVHHEHRSALWARSWQPSQLPGQGVHHENHSPQPVHHEHLSAFGQQLEATPTIRTRRPYHAFRSPDLPDSCEASKLISHELSKQLSTSPVISCKIAVFAVRVPAPAPWAPHRAPSWLYHLKNLMATALPVRTDDVVWSVLRLSTDVLHLVHDPESVVPLGALNRGRKTT